MDSGYMHHAVVEKQETSVTVHSHGSQGQQVEQTLTLEPSEKVVNGNLSEPEDNGDKWDQLGGEGFQEVTHSVQ